MHKRALLIFAVSFGTVLLAGVAFAQVGVFETPATDTATASHTEPAEEPAEPEVKEPEPEPYADEKPEPTYEANDEVVHTEEPAAEEAEAEEPASGEEPEPATVEHEVWIEVLHPKPEQVVENKYVVFEGHTSAETRVFRGKYEADVKYHSGEGIATWRLALVLSAGEQRVTFEAVGPNGETATDSVVVIYEGQEPKEEPKEEPGSDFTAHQKYGECAETPPYDVFYGTGEPGTKIWIESAFGGGETIISEKGNWDLKVKFWEAPCNEEIQVVLETSDGDRKVFEFMRVCEEESKDH